MKVNITLEFLETEARTVLTLDVPPLPPVVEDLTDPQSIQITDQLIEVLRRYIPQGALTPDFSKPKH